MGRPQKHSFNIDIFADGIEEIWNVPILNNAAELFNSTCSFFDRHNIREKLTGIPSERFIDSSDLTSLKNKYDQIIACETGSRSKNIFQYKYRPLNTALIVGNELTGISKEIINVSDDILSIPMKGKEIPSLNVGVAAGLSLYCLFHNHLGTKKLRRNLFPDILLLNPENPYELGSILRTLCCFGWNSIYLKDDHKLWYGSKRLIKDKVLEASRGKRNHTSIKPYNKLSNNKYNVAYLMTKNSGTPLSRLNFSAGRKSIFILPDNFDSEPDEEIMDFAKTHKAFHIDFPNKHIHSLYRLRASVVLMEIVRNFI